MTFLHAIQVSQIHTIYITEIFPRVVVAADAEQLSASATLIGGSLSRDMYHAYIARALSLEDHIARGRRLTRRCALSLPYDIARIPLA
eukprot:1182402-Prorocentrum_minimum.AAC.1